MSDLLSGLGGALGGVTDLLSGGAIFDAVGNLLGLPPAITDAAKTVVGAMTGNVMLAADGAMGIAKDLSQDPPAATEYQPPQDSRLADEGYAPSGSMHEATPVGTSDPGGCDGGSGSSRLDPKMNDYFDSLQTLEQNFPYLDALDGKLDGSLSLADLQRTAADTRVSPALREAARFLTNNPGYFERLETSAGDGAHRFGHLDLDALNDDRVSLNNVKNELQNVKADFAQYGRPGRVESPPPFIPTPSIPEPDPGPPPSGCSSSPGCAGGSSMKDIINDPSLSLEEKINAILGNLTGKMDDEILQTMDDLTAAQDKKAGLTNSQGDQKALTQAQNDIDRISLRLQQLVEKRKSMFEMMSTLSMKFDEMANTALSNMRSA